MPVPYRSDQVLNKPTRIQSKDLPRGPLSNNIHQTSEEKKHFLVNDLDLPQNLMGSSLAHAPIPPLSLVKISYVAFAKTCRQMNEKKSHILVF